MAQPTLCLHKRTINLPIIFQEICATTAAFRGSEAVSRGERNNVPASTTGSSNANSEGLILNCP